MVVKLSDHPEMLVGAFSNLRKMQVKPTRKAILSKKEPESPREIMDGNYILKRDEEELVEERK